MIEVTLSGITMSLQTHPRLFLPNSLDKGTNAMLSCVSFQETDKVLDLGCGYGVVGIYAALQIGAQRVSMSDISETAVETARENARLNGVADIRIYVSDGFRSIDDAGYTLILTNPPYHTDFGVAKHFIEKGFNRLVTGGRMAMVTKRREWYQNKLTAIFGGVTIKALDGYFVFIAEKRSPSYANKKPR